MLSDSFNPTTWNGIQILLEDMVYASSTLADHQPVSVLVDPDNLKIYLQEKRIISARFTVYQTED